METLVEVFYKKNYGDKKARSIKARLESVGLKGIEEVVPSTIYKLTGGYGAQEARAIAANLLTDPVLETSSLTVKKPKGASKVAVWIRDSSTDVVGESVAAAVAAAGYAKPQSARVGHAFAIKGKFKKADLEAAVKKTFVNTVLNKFTVEEF